jgi:hypothetical protein
MLLIILAMIVGSTLSAFSLPSATASSFSGIRLAPQKPAAQTPFIPPPSVTAPSVETGKNVPRGSLLNISV